MRVPSSPRLDPPFDGGRTGRQFSGAIFGNTGTGSVSHHRGRDGRRLVSSRGGGRWGRAHQRRVKIATERPRSLSPVSWPGPLLRPNLRNMTRHDIGKPLILLVSYYRDGLYIPLVEPPNPLSADPTKPPRTNRVQSTSRR
jgi:hypothetical protein